MIGTGQWDFRGLGTGLVIGRLLVYALPAHLGQSQKEVVLNKNIANAVSVNVTII